MAPPTIAEISALILPRIEKDSRILAAYLLGSLVSGGMRPDSDIDIALLAYPGQRFSALERAELGSTLAFEIGREVDIGALESINLIYAKEAILNGRRVFERDLAAADRAEAALLGMYVSFNEDRRELLDAYSI